MLRLEKRLTGALRWLFLFIGGAILTLPGLIAVGGSIAAYWRPHLSQLTVATVQEAPAPLAPTPGNIWAADFQTSVEVGGSRDLLSQ